MGENIYEGTLPILFADETRRNEYQKRQREKTKRLLEATESQTVTEFLVKLVFGEDFQLPVRLVDTKIEAHGQGVLDLASSIEKINSYNAFRGKQVADAVRSLHNEGYIMDARFGREGSPVLYVQPPYWENQASNYVRKEEQSRKLKNYSEEQRAGMYQAIQHTLKETKPDELEIDNFGYVRAWWD